MSLLGAEVTQLSHFVSTAEVVDFMFYVIDILLTERRL